ncbi:MAG: ATP-binding protein [Bacteroidales bacterium]|jgi:DNA transposition AAA+ family ATPase|nr:ATP-binding protein [Bacteroidales bacterium]
MITLNEKLEIRDCLQRYCEQRGSQNKAANTLNGVSSATISKLLNNEWDLINEVMWRSIAAQIGVKQKSWNIVETRDFKTLTYIFKDAQENAMVMAVCGEAGSGKSLTARAFSESNKNVFLLNCNEYWNRKLFMQELLREMGKNSYGDTVGEMMQSIVSELKRTENPLIVMDEADKLSDQVLYFFITLYNQLEDHCGIILLATDHLEKKIKRGLRLNKKGYKEIYSRIGRKFIMLKGANITDITEICAANGLTEKTDIKTIIDDCENDLRRVKRKVHSIHKVNASKQ